MAGTIQQIAELAGVSRGTVDRALNNRGRINPEVAKQIWQIADKVVKLKGRVFSKAIKTLGLDEILVQINRSEVVNLMNVEKIIENSVYLSGVKLPLLVSKYQKSEVLRRFSDFKVRT